MKATNKETANRNGKVLQDLQESILDKNCPLEEQSTLEHESLNQQFTTLQEEKQASQSEQRQIWSSCRESQLLADFMGTEILKSKALDPLQFSYTTLRILSD
jgi:hypothetical protein